jgi:hypothetical protein
MSLPQHCKTAVMGNDADDHAMPYTYTHVACVQSMVHAVLA